MIVPSLSQLLDNLLTSPDTGSSITRTRHLPARSAQTAPFPSWLDARIVKALQTCGIHELYSHQARALEITDKGGHLVVVTPTASGKTLCYNLPILHTLVHNQDARALYLFPTKALAQDQLAELNNLAKALPELRMFTYDGDTPQDARRSVRARANVVLTNPDMLHSGILPHHTKWLPLFENLRYVVIDELHAYRGVFGSHLGNVLRRLKRLCRYYGSTPQFIMASATIANPRDLAEKLTGETVEELTETGAPSGEKLIVLYNPPVVNEELGIRASYLMESAKLAIRFLKAKVPTIVFAQSRLTAEVLLSTIKSAVEQKPGEAGLVRGYRGGYLPGRRREIERGLREGEVLGVVSTNALELGVDIGHLDLAILAGYPGTIASMWQQAGRAGRRNELAAAILVASSAPLDQFMVENADYLFGSPPEHALINPDNPYILIDHLKCAAFELPFSEGERFGESAIDREIHALTEEGLLHEAGGRYHWTSETYPADHLSLRTVTTDNFLVIDTTARDAKEKKGRKVIAEVDWKGAFQMIYPKAIYLIEGEQYEVQELHFREDEEKVAYVKRVSVDYFTDAISAKGVWLLEAFDRAPSNDVEHSRGEVLVAEKVVGFKKIKFQTMENVGSGEVELPQQEMQTPAYWIAIKETLLERVSPSRDELIDGLRGVAYLLHQLAPAFLMCDVRDLGSWLGEETPVGEERRVRTVREVRQALLALPRFAPAIYLYDSHPGGVGLSEKLYTLHAELLSHARARLGGCRCRLGCPSCVGPVNEVGRKAKAIARALLERLIASV